MNADDLMTQDMEVWSVQLDGTVTDDSGSELDLDAVEETVKTMQEQVESILKAVALARRMVALTKAE